MMLLARAFALHQITPDFLFYLFCLFSLCLFLHRWMASLNLARWIIVDPRALDLG
jgi:hypothetical protein